MPEIVRCPTCDEETYRGLAACPHCGDAMPPQLSLGAPPPPGDDEPGSSRAVPAWLTVLAGIATGLLVKVLLLG